MNNSRLEDLYQGFWNQILCVSMGENPNTAAHWELKI